MPTQYHQIGDIMKEHDVEKYLIGLSSSIDNAVKQLSSHQEFIT